MPSILNIRDKWRAQVRVAGMRNRCATFETEAEAVDWAIKEEKSVRDTKRGTLLNPDARPVPYQMAGVYALFKGFEVRYIGRSVHILRRLSDHDRAAMDWDGYRVWECRDAIECAKLETRLIKKHRPPLNIAMKPA